MFFDGAEANAEVEGHFFVAPTVEEATENLLLAPGEPGQVFVRVGRGRCFGQHLPGMPQGRRARLSAESVGRPTENP